jgi:glycosyltransferase involved in cell wall biosynthesis
MGTETHPHPLPTSISVIVPVRNGAKTLAEQLAALALQDYAGDWEVIIADNGSTDHTRTLAELWIPRIPRLSIIDASGRPGPSFARNRGAEHAKGDFLAFCDADDAVAPAWLSALAIAAQDFDAVTGRQEASYINTVTVQSWRPARRKSLQSSRAFLPYAPTNNLGVWASVFRETGGFNEDYRQSEDVEWSWRTQLASFSIGFAEDAVVHYRYRSSTLSVARQGYLTGVGSARLYRDYRSRGLRRSPFKRVLRTWAWLPSHVQYLFSPPKRGVWIRRAAEAAGRLAGSVRLRVLFL